MIGLRHPVAIASALTALTALGAAVPTMAFGAEAAAAPVYSLDDCLKRMEEAPALDAARAAVRVASARLAEARARGYPRLDARASIEPTFARTGDPLDAHPSDKAIFPIDVPWGPYVRASARASWAILQFGRVAAAKKRAKAAIISTAAEERAARGALQRTIVEAYVTAAARTSALADLDATLASSAALREEMERLLDLGSFVVSRRDVHRLDSKVARLRADRATLVADYFKAVATLASVLGEPVRPAPLETLTPFAPLGGATTREAVVASMRAHPDLVAMRAAVAEREAHAKEVARAVWPSFSVWVDAGIRWAPHIDDQSTSFAYDPWNGMGVGGGGVLSWTLDPGMAVARLERANLETARARELLRAAETAVAREVTEAWFGAGAEVGRLEAAERRLALSRRMRHAVEALAAVGLRTPLDLLGALHSVSGAEREHVDAISRRVVSSARAVLAAGGDLRRVPKAVTLPMGPAGHGER